MLSLSSQLILVHNISNLLKKRITYFIILIFIVIKYAIAVYINDCTKHQLHFVSKVYDIGYICVITIRPSRLVENTDVGRNRCSSRFEHKELGIALKKF